MSRSVQTEKREPQTLVDGVTFNDVTTTYTSASIDAKAYRKFILHAHKEVANTPTNIEVRVQFSHDNTNWFNYTRGPFGYLAWEDTAGTEDESIDGEVVARYMRVYVVATGTTAVNTFTLTVNIELMA